MAERATKRPAGATRLPDQPDAPTVLLSIDVSGFTHDDLVRALTDRGLSTTGNDDALRTRLTDDVNGA